MYVAQSGTRVSRNTPEYINERIRRRAQERIARVASQGRLAREARLGELEREWDIERVLQTQASGLVLLGLALGTFVHRRWYLLSAGVAGLLMQHAVQGYCPPLGPLRRLGVRTSREIEEERHAVLDLGQD